MSKTVMHEFWYTQPKSRYGKKTPKLCYLDIKEIYSDIDLIYNNELDRTIN